VNYFEPPREKGAVLPSGTCPTNRGVISGALTSVQHGYHHAKYIHANTSPMAREIRNGAREKGRSSSIRKSSRALAAEPEYAVSVAV
jgi:hypothetical protein